MVRLALMVRLGPFVLPRLRRAGALGLMPLAPSVLGRLRLAPGALGLMRFASLVFLILLRWSSEAAEWGGVQPGVTSREQVNDRYGPPSKENRPKIEGYDTIQWVYENTRAPAGIIRMTIDFGILAPSGFKSNVVRVLTLEPKPSIFGRMTLIQGWGLPDGISNNPDGSVNLLWKDGLFVTLDKEGEEAAVMVFSPPQPTLEIPPLPPGTPGSPPPSQPGTAAPKR